MPAAGGTPTGGPEAANFAARPIYLVMKEKVEGLDRMNWGDGMGEGDRGREERPWHLLYLLGAKAAD